MLEWKTGIRCGLFSPGYFSGFLDIWSVFIKNVLEQTNKQTNKTMNFKLHQSCFKEDNFFFMQVYCLSPFDGYVFRHRIKFEVLAII